jgi:putative flippase GtrA
MPVDLGRLPLALSDALRRAVPDRLRPFYDKHEDKLRYLVAGMWNTVFSIALYNVLLSLLGPAVHSLAASQNGFLAFLGRNDYNTIFWLNWVLCVPQATLAMKYFAFRTPGGRTGREIGKAYFVYLPAQLVSSGIVWLTVERMQLSPRIAQVFAIVFSTIFSYLGHKYFTFRGGAAESVETGGIVEALSGEEDGSEGAARDPRP